LSGFSRRERDASKALETAGGLLETGSAVANVALYDFGGGDLTGVSNCCGCNYERCRFRVRCLAQGDSAARESDTGLSESGVAKTEAIGKEQLCGSIGIGREPGGACEK